MSPMCQYSAHKGVVQDWHLLHYPTRALGGVSLVLVEATAVSEEGQISPFDLGIWSDDHIPGLHRLAQAIQEAGAIPGLQLAHAGRKAGTARPWEGGKPLGLWVPVAPSPMPFAEGYPVPQELDERGLERIRQAFRSAAQRALQAGFQLIELHMAHGYLLHEFLSPLSNQRSDAYGGSLEHRMRFPLEVARAVREVWPPELPLWVRVSAVDWVEGGWTLEETVEFARALAPLGIDLLDCSSGGNAIARIPAGPGYQAPFAAAVRRESPLASGAVGLITEPFQAETLLRTDQADLILLGRALLREPYWPLRAAQEFKETLWPPQYDRAFR